MKSDAGLVLTLNSIVCPAAILVREQYPSIQGQRYWADGSTRVFVKSQSPVPGFSFSRRTRSRDAVAFTVDPVAKLRPDSPSTTPAPAAAALLVRRAG